MYLSKVLTFTFFDWNKSCICGLKDHIVAVEPVEIRQQQLPLVCSLASKDSCFISCNQWSS